MQSSTTSLEARALAPPLFLKELELTSRKGRHVGAVGAVNAFTVRASFSAASNR
jgi:hypothetical protein